MTSFLVGVHDVASFFSFSKCHVSNPLPNYSNNWFKQLCQDRDLQQLSSLGSVCAAVISSDGRQGARFSNTFPQRVCVAMKATGNPRFQPSFSHERGSRYMTSLGRKAQPRNRKIQFFSSLSKQTLGSHLSMDSSLVMKGETTLNSL